MLVRVPYARNQEMINSVKENIICRDMLIPGNQQLQLSFIGYIILSILNVIMLGLEYIVKGGLNTL